MQLIHGAPQDYALTLDKILEHAAKWHGKKGVLTALEGGQVRHTGYSELLLRAKRLSGVLARQGVQTGDCVATLAWNTHEHMESWYAIMGIGAVCHTLNPRLPGETLASMLRQSRARLLIASADQFELVSDIAKCRTALTTVFFIDGPGEFWETSLPGGLSVGTLFGQSEAPPVAWGGFDENLPCGLCFTSGTAGAPKGVTYTHRGNFLHTMRQLQADVAGIVERDVVLPVVPMFHANAWGLPFACPAVGATLVLPGRATDGASLAQLIVDHGVTIAVGVPTIWLDLFDHLDRSGMALPSLRRIMVGGAPMPVALSRRLAERGIELQQTWGMTELSPLGTSVRPGRTGELSGSGNPALGIDLLITDHEGQVLDRQRRQEGRLHVRGPTVVERYFGQTEAATHDGWFDTGDLAIISDDGALTITGRVKNLIKSGGEWVNPVEIENAVGALPQVAKVAVVARQHPRWGERPIMVVELVDGSSVSDEDLLQPVREQFAKWWVPDDVIRVLAIPLAATGKIDKQQLQDRYGKP